MIRSHRVACHTNYSLDAKFLPANRSVSPPARIPTAGTSSLIPVKDTSLPSAPTGSGKTSGPVICNALNHRGQLIVLDMKGEVHAATAQARRAMGQQVHVLDLRDDAQTDLASILWIS